MIDNEIIKALEGCWLEDNCEHCPMKKDNKCKAILRQTALDLINRQKAEIEDYKESNKMWSDALNNANEENTELQFKIDELQRKIVGCNSDILNEYKARIQVKEMVVCADSLGEWLEFLDEFKDEAIQEFAERLKETFPNNSHWIKPREKVDNLVQETVGDNNV